MQSLSFITRIGQVGVAYLLALESANNLNVSPKENIDYDR